MSRARPWNEPRANKWTTRNQWIRSRPPERTFVFRGRLNARGKGATAPHRARVKPPRPHIIAVALPDKWPRGALLLPRLRRHLLPGIAALVPGSLGSWIYWYGRNSLVWA